MPRLPRKRTTAAAKPLLRQVSPANAADWVVWVLVPVSPAVDDHLGYYSDYAQSHAEFTRAFEVLGVRWHWTPVGVNDAAATISAIATAARSEQAIVLNLCDGDETNGIPGVNVIDILEAYGLPYTGANRHFYDITTSKIPMKRAFDASHVPTARWQIVAPGQRDWSAPFQSSTRPLIVKPAISAGSMGIGVQSVVHTPEALAAQVTQLAQGYRGWDLSAGGIFVEEYIAGREFTTFIVGDHAIPIDCTIYPPVERVFNRQLPATEQFLSFDRLWEFYDSEAPLPDGAYLWEYQRVLDEKAAAIAQVSMDAYCAVGGTGYGRVDLREDEVTGELFVLEVNAQCGLSEDENFTSIGAILRYAQVPYHQLVHNLLIDTVARSARGLSAVDEGKGIDHGLPALATGKAKSA